MIRSSGTDLLRLLDDILDLAKVESGTVTLDIGELALVELQGAIERDFGPVADTAGPVLLRWSSPPACLRA